MFDLNSPCENCTHYGDEEFCSPCRKSRELEMKRQVYMAMHSNGECKGTCLDCKTRGCEK